MERAVELELRLARVLVRHADGRLRPRLHRQHGRDDVRVRGEERQAALGAAARQLHLRRGGGLPAQGVRGTYDGKFYALDAATGDTSWQIDAPAAVHAAPTVMDGLVYYAICSSCGSAAQRAVARGPDSTYAVRARDGKRVWRFPGGKYANPVVADQDRVYITGRSQQYALRGQGRRRRPGARDRRRPRRQRLGKSVEKSADPVVTVRRTSSEASGSPST